MESNLTDLQRANLRVKTQSLQLQQKDRRISTLEAKLAQREAEVRWLTASVRADTDLVVLLQKKLDWNRERPAFCDEPDWSEVMREYHALTPTEPKEQNDG